MGTPDGFRPARLTIGIISAGRVGTALGVALERAEHVVVACSAISHASRQRAQRRLPDTAVLPVDEVAGRAELLLLAVPDAELSGLVSGLAATEAVRPGTIVVHTSGANGVGVLAQLTERGCIPLAIHPAMTFTGSDEDIERLPDTCFGITAADEVGYAIAPVAGAGDRRRAVPGPRGRPHALPRGAGACEQPRRHRAARCRRGAERRVVGSGAAGAGTGRRRTRRHCRAGDRSAGEGVARERAAARAGGADGPVARGDAAAVARHLRALAEVEPELAQAYRANSLRTAQRAHAPKEVFAVFSDFSGQP